MISLLLILISIWYAWRYSKTTIDPDWAMFNLAGFTGSIYGRDFADCKTPAIHIWYWLLVKLVGKNIYKVKFVHHMIIGLAAIPIYLVSGNQWIAFAYLILVNSGWLFAFHGNVGQQPAAFITLALVVGDPYVAMVLWWLALAFEPKLILAFIAWLAIGLMLNQALITVVLASTVGLSLYMLRKWEPVKWLIEANITIPARMMVVRRKLWKHYLEIPNYLNTAHLYFTPVVLSAMLTEPVMAMWLPPALYVALIWYGLAVRPNHYLLVIPWVAVAFGAAPTIVIILAAVDWLSGTFYLGDLWKRFYPGLYELNNHAKQIGLYLRDKPGVVYVNDLHTAIYIYARKKVPYNFAAQIEIREVSDGRREKMLQLWKDNPADWVVHGPSPLFDFSEKGYSMQARAGGYTVWKKVVKHGK